MPCQILYMIRVKFKSPNALLFNCSSHLFLIYAWTRCVFTSIDEYDESHTCAYIHSISIPPFKVCNEKNSRQWQRRSTSSWINAWPLPSKEARHDSARWAPGESQRPFLFAALPIVAGTQTLLEDFGGSPKKDLFKDMCWRIFRKKIWVRWRDLKYVSGWNYNVVFCIFTDEIISLCSTKMTPRSTNQLSSSNLTLFQMYQEIQWVAAASARQVVCARLLRCHDVVGFFENSPGEEFWLGHDGQW